MRSYQAPETALESAIDKLQKKKKRRDNTVYKSLANMKLKKQNTKVKRKRKEKLDTNISVNDYAVHKTNCAAWGCKCKEKGKKKEEPPTIQKSYSREWIPPVHKNINKIKTWYPGLYKWD